MRSVCTEECEKHEGPLFFFLKCFPSQRMSQGNMWFQSLPSVLQLLWHPSKCKALYMHEFLSLTGRAWEAMTNTSQCLPGIWDGFWENTSSCFVDPQGTSVGGAFHSKYVPSHHLHSANAMRMCEIWCKPRTMKGDEGSLQECSWPHTASRTLKGGIRVLCVIFEPSWGMNAAERNTGRPQVGAEQRQHYINEEVRSSFLRIAHLEK